MRAVRSRRPTEKATPQRRLMEGLFDARLHPATLEDRDLDTLRLFGVSRVLAVIDGAAARTPAAVFEAFEHLLGHELPRLRRAGLDAWAAIGVPPAALPKRGLSLILERLPAYLRGGRVVALGLLGLGEGGAPEVEALSAQLELAQRFNLPAVVSTPTLHREPMTRRLLAVLREGPLPPDRILVDGAVTRTAPVIRELGFYTGLTLHPDMLTVERAVTLVRRLGPERLVLASAAGLGASDLLAVSRAAHRLASGGVSRPVVRRVARDNAATLLGLRVE